jgi:hypothetical protein
MREQSFMRPTDELRSQPVFCEALPEPIRAPALDRIGCEEEARQDRTLGCYAMKCPEHVLLRGFFENVGETAPTQEDRRETDIGHEQLRRVGQKKAGA